MLSLLVNLDKSTLNAQLVDGVVLMLLGMATVFLFLVLLIYATKLMSKICTKIGGKATPTIAKNTNTQNTAPVAKAQNDAALAAAIVAAYDKEKN